MNRFENIDCMIGIESVESHSVDLILEDMPYNTTACEWDVKIDLTLYWETRLRILKPTGVIVLTASQPFTTDLISSNKKFFKYEWIWEKSRPTRFLLANKMPLLSHENILVFYSQQPTYNPLKWKIDEKYIDRRKNHNDRVQAGGQMAGVYNPRNYDDGMRYPFSIISIDSDWNKDMHPTQKPVGLFEYFIRTYTNENDLVFDGFAGSGTTAIACLKSDRNYICFELDKDYYEAAQKRLKQFRSQLKLAINY